MLRVDTRTNMKERSKQASDYNITPISTSPVGDGRGLLVVFLTRESAALVQAQGLSPTGVLLIGDMHESEGETRMV